MRQGVFAARWVQVVNSNRRRLERRSSSVLVALMFAAFADTLGSFLVLALLPYYASDLGASSTQVGWLVASFAVAQTLTAPLWGRLSDRVGRRPVILLGLAILVVSFAIFAFADSLLILMLSRLAQGVGGGTVSVTFALISDESRSHQTAMRIGWLTAATSGAALVGPLLGSALVPYSTQAPGLAAAALCLVSLLLCWSMLPASPLQAEGAQQRPTSLPSGEVVLPTETLFVSIVKVLRDPGQLVHLLIWTYAVGMFGTNAVLAVIGLFLEQRHRIGVAEIWQFFALLAGASLVLRVALLPLLLRAWGERRVLLQGTWLLGLSLVLIPLAEGRWLLAVATLLLAAGQSLLYPATTALISTGTSQATRGAILGVQQTWGGVARITGPVVAGMLFLRAPELPFFVAGGVLLSWAALLTWRLSAP